MFDTKILQSLRPQPPQKALSNIYPIEVFPPAIKAFALEAYNSLGFPIDYVLSAVISVAGLAVGNTHELMIKSTWRIKAIIYMAIVGRAGDYKSHSQKLAFAPIREYNAREYALYAERMKEYKKEMQAYKVLQNKDNVIEPEKPVCKRRTVADHTNEALTESLQHNPAICVVMDELKSWISNFGRYNKGSEVEFWLSAFNGDDIDIIRKTSEPLFVKAPYLGVCGGIQPGVLAELAKDGKDKNGFTDRILFAYPDSLPVAKYNEADMPQEVLNDYANTINRLLELPLYRDEYNNIKPSLLTLSKEAKELWKVFFDTNAQAKHEADDDTIAGIYTKLEVYVLRFALILQMLKYATNTGGCTEITNESMQGAIKLAEYYRHTAMKAAAIMSNNNPLLAMTKTDSAFYTSLPDFFTTSEAKEIAERMGIKRTRFFSMLKDKSLFTCIAHGKYEKAA